MMLKAQPSALSRFLYLLGNKVAGDTAPYRELVVPTYQRLIASAGVVMKLDA